MEKIFRHLVCFSLRKQQSKAAGAFFLEIRILTQLTAMFHIHNFENWYRDWSITYQTRSGSIVDIRAHNPTSILSSISLLHSCNWQGLNDSSKSHTFRCIFGENKASEGRRTVRKRVTFMKCLNKFCLEKKQLWFLPL